MRAPPSGIPASGRVGRDVGSVAQGQVSKSRGKPSRHWLSRGMTRPGGHEDGGQRPAKKVDKRLIYLSGPPKFSFVAPAAAPSDDLLVRAALLKVVGRLRARAVKGRHQDWSPPSSQRPEWIDEQQQACMTSTGARSALTIIPRTRSASTSRRRISTPRAALRAGGAVRQQRGGAQAAAGVGRCGGPGGVRIDGGLGMRP